MATMVLPQILYIHGGMTFPSREALKVFLGTLEISSEERKKWADMLPAALGEVCDVIKPRMPMKEDARYDEWKIYFERHLPLLHDGLILIGNSLGGIFLAKYLSENTIPVKLAAVYLVCPPFDNTLSTEELLGGLELGDDLSGITAQCDHVQLYFSGDDVVVPVAHADKYRDKLPDASITVFDSKNGHFQVEEFPELLADIRRVLEVNR